MMSASYAWAPLANKQLVRAFTKTAGAFAAKWRAPQLSQLVDRLGALGKPLRGSSSLQSGFSHLESPQEEAKPGEQEAPASQVPCPQSCMLQNSIVLLS